MGGINGEHREPGMGMYGDLHFVSFFQVFGPKACEKLGGRPKVETDLTPSKQSDEADLGTDVKLYVHHMPSIWGP